MKPKTISILGCGWLGLPLGTHLATHGYTVRGSTTTPVKVVLLRALGIEPYWVTLAPDVRASEVLDFFDADVLVLNLPPQRGGGPEAARRFVQQIEAIRTELHYSPIDFVVFVSSTSVYDDMNGPVTERDAGRPLPPSPVSRALLDAETLLREDTRFDTTVLRLAGLYGYGRHPGRFLAGRTDLANGDAPVNLVHRDDVVAVITRIIEDDVRGEVFNVCADEHPRRRDFYPAAARRLGLAAPTFREGGPTAFKVVRNDWLKQRLGYAFRHPDPAAEAP